jgi:hypothetical protein
MAVQRQIADISRYVETHFSEIFNKYAYYPLIVDESTDIRGIFSSGITSDFEVFEELLDLHSMRGQKKG